MSLDVVSIPTRETEAEHHAAENRLHRVIGPWGLGANAVNAAVGGGIFALPAVVAAMLGPAAIVAYLVCGAAIALVLVCFVEMGSQVTRSGGSVAYIEAAFGPLAGFFAWVLVAFGLGVVADAAIAHVLMDAVSLVSPLAADGIVRVAGLALIFGGLALVNVRGVRQGIHLGIATTLAKIVPLLLVIAVGAFAMRWTNLTVTEWPSIANVGQASLLLFFAFGGADCALLASGEIHDSARTVPRAILGAVAFLVALYLALQVVSQGVLGDQLARETGAPLAAVAARLMGEGGRSLILLCTALAVFGSLSVDLLGAPRTFLAASRAGVLPGWFAAVHPRFRTPHRAIITYAGLGFLTALTGAFRSLAAFSSVATLLVYLGVCLGVLRLRRTGSAAGVFRAPGGPVIPWLAAASMVWLLGQSTAREVLSTTIVLATAAIVYLIQRRTLARSLGAVETAFAADDGQGDNGRRRF